jgi:hypothetical protein
MEKPSEHGNEPLRYENKGNVLTSFMSISVSNTLLLGVRKPKTRAIYEKTE